MNKKMSVSSVSLVIIVGILLCIGFGAITNHAYFTAMNLSTILYLAAMFGTLAIAETLVLLVGEIDLSVGIICFVSPSLSIYLISWLRQQFGGTSAIRAQYVEAPWLLCVVVILVVSSLIGLINGLIVVRLKVPAFIATMGMSSIVQGIGFVITKGTPLFMNRVNGASWLGNHKLFGAIPMCFFLFLIVGGVYVFLLRYTKFGSRVYATGGNVVAARLSGINPQKWKLIMFVLSGLVSGISAVILLSRLVSIDITQNASYEMTALAIAIVGGISLAGGVGRMLDVMLAALFMAALANAMSGIGLLSYHRDFVTGLFIILFAVIFKRAESRKLKRENIVEV